MAKLAVRGAIAALGVCNTSEGGCHSAALRSRADGGAAWALASALTGHARRRVKPAGATLPAMRGCSPANRGVLHVREDLCSARTQAGRNRTKVALRRSAGAGFLESIQTGHAGATRIAAAFRANATGFLGASLAVPCPVRPLTITPVKQAERGDGLWGHTAAGAFGSDGKQTGCAFRRGA